jgi:hypothetical protein
MDAGEFGFELAFPGRMRVRRSGTIVAPGVLPAPLGVSTMTVQRPLAIALLACGVVAAAPPPTADAQGRRVRVVSARPVVFVGAYSYRPYGYDPWFWGPGFHPGPMFYSAAAYPTSGVRIEVTPKDAEVFVDGYLVGIVDDFNGFFQRLTLPPGQYEITLHRDGYRQVTQRIYLSPGATYRLRHTLVALAPGESAGSRPVPEPGASRAYDPRRPGRGAAPRDIAPPEPDIAPPDAADYGQLAIRVQPEGAEVLIDGEPWQGPEGHDRLVVHLAPGRHRIEVRKDGYEPFSTTVTVQPGQTAALNVSLQP